MAFYCPIDGKELAEGEPCPEHGIAFTEYKPAEQRRAERPRPEPRTIGNTKAKARNIIGADPDHRREHKR